MLVTGPRPITKTGEGGGRGGEDMDDLLTYTVVLMEAAATFPISDGTREVGTQIGTVQEHKQAEDEEAWQGEDKRLVLTQCHSRGDAPSPRVLSVSPVIRGPCRVRTCGVWIL